MKKDNAHTTREGWLQAAANELRPYFEKHGYSVPENIRLAIGFPSSGKRGHKMGECWHSNFSADRHYEIIIRNDLDDPVEILGQLVPQLIHAYLPLEAKNGKAFRDVALRIGLKGSMRRPSPTLVLKERLQAIVANLGPLPHAKLDFARKAGTVKKSGARYLKAECGMDGCGYTVRLIPKWAKAGLPVCPLNAKHGRLKCEIPDEEQGDNE
ncbi:MAG TPA: transcription elongation protein SprT [Alphaproteobacteria bacterium]|nr:transcription elongation protein SprT [Alphaproteobacteria bacterium]